MATTKTISEALNLVETKKQNLKNAFENLQSQSLFLHSLPLSWLEINSHFTSIQHSLTHRFHFLQSLEQSHSQSQFKTPTSQTSKDAIFTGKTSKDAIFTGKTNRNELGILCEKMDGLGLRNYIMGKFKDRVMIQAELVEVFRCAPDAGEMILQSLEGFHGVNGNYNDKGLRKMRRVCIMLLKLLSVDGLNVSSKAREKALKVAFDWKKILMGDNGNVVGALGFFYLVYGFGIVSKFSMDVLVEFAAMAAVNGEFVQLCRDVGLTDRVPEIVQKLVDRRKHVLAVKYVFEFNLAHKIPPVPILKAGVDEARNLALRLSQEGKPRMEIINREVHSLRSIIEVIENHKLESEYPRASLDRRIEELNGQDANVKHKPPASPLTQQPLQLRQQNGIKLLQTFTSGGPESVLDNVSNNNSTTYEYQQPLVNPSGLFPEYPNPYMSLRALPPRMVVPTPTVPSYTGPSAGPYGFAGIPTGPSLNPSLGGSHLNSSEQHVPFAYNDFNNFTYGGINLRPHYQASYYPH